MDSVKLNPGRMALQAVAGLTALAALVALATLGVRSLSHSVSGAVQAEAKADPDSAGKFLHLLDYVAGDYHEAVSGGAIVDQEEYDEQIEFVGKATQVLEGFPDGPSKAKLSILVERLRKSIEAKTYPSVVEAAVIGVRSVLQTAGLVEFTPGHAPDQLRGRDLFAANCAQCHGPSGHGDGPAGLSLSPRPADFHDRRRMGGKTPLQAFNSVRFGVDGTAMAGFAGMSREDVWDLAYYVLSLGSVPGVSGSDVN